MRIISLFMAFCLLVCIPFGCASMAEATGGESSMQYTLVTEENFDNVTNELSESIDSISKISYKSETETLTWSDGKYVAYWDGTIKTNVSTAKMSDYVPIEYGNKIKIYGKTYYDINALFFYDINKSFIGSFPNDGTLEKKYEGTEVTLPNGTKYVRMCYDSSAYNSVPTLLKMSIYAEDKTAQSGIASVKEYLNDITELKYEEVTDITWNSGYFINRTTGANQSLETCKTSDYISIPYGQTVMFTGKSYYDVNCLFYYDSNNTYLGCFPNSSTSTTKYTNHEITLPDNCSKIKICYDSSGTYTPQIKIFQPFAKVKETKKWEGYRWCAIGDSLTENNSKASKKYHKIIEEETGITVLNYGVGGTGYSAMKASNLAFYQRIANVPTDADVYTIFGSFNDIGITIGTVNDRTNETLCGCIYLALTALYERNPNAIVGIITPTPWEWCNPYREPNSGDLYVEALISMANKWSIPVLDLYHSSNLRPWNDTCKVSQFGDADGVHPNNLGNEMIAPKIEAFLDALLLK